VIRSSTSGAPVNTKVRQSAWTLDKLDGTGPSGVVLDLTQSQLMVIDYQWFGVGTIRWGFVINGALRYAHVTYTSNLASVVYMRMPNLPLRFELVNDGTGPVATLTAICTSVLSEGGVVTKGNARSVSRDATPLQTTNTANLFPVLALRKQANRSQVVFQPTVATVIATSTAVLQWQLLVNPIFAGPPLSFSAVTGSYMEVATPTNTNTVFPDITPASGYATDQLAGVTTLDLPRADLGESLFGVRDILVLAARRITGTTEDVYASLSWIEYT
jgi:hypothetical protein